MGFGGMVRSAVSGPKAGRGQNATGKEYAILKRYGGVTEELDLEKALHFLQGSNMPLAAKKLAEAELRTLGRANLTGNHITQEKIATAKEELEGIIGAPQTAEVIKTLEGMFDRGRERTGQEIEKRVRGAKNLHPYQREVAARLLGGLDQKGQPLRKYGRISHQHIAQTAERLRSTMGEHAATLFERPFSPAEPKGMGGEAPGGSQRVGRLQEQREQGKETNQ